MTDDLLIRPARAGDAPSLSRLSALDSATSFGPHLAALARLAECGAVLVAERDGALVAALDVQKGAIVADPFQPSATARELLARRCQQLRNARAASGSSSDRQLARRLIRTG